MGSKLLKNSKLIFYSISGQWNFSIFVSFHTEEPVVSKMHLGWRHTLLGIEFCFFNEKSWVQNFLKNSNLLFYLIFGLLKFSIFVSFHAEEPLVSKMQLGWWNIWKGIGFGFFKEKSWVQNFIKIPKYYFIQFPDGKSSQFLSHCTQWNLWFSKCI